MTGDGGEEAGGTVAGSLDVVWLALLAFFVLLTALLSVELVLMADPKTSTNHHLQLSSSASSPPQPTTSAKETKYLTTDERYPPTINPILRHHP